MYADFLNSIPKKSYSELTKRRAILSPPLGKARFFFENQLNENPQISNEKNDGAVWWFMTHLTHVMWYGVGSVFLVSYKTCQSGSTMLLLP